MVVIPRYGRLLGDFVPGDVYAHPWEVTLDEGMMAFFASACQCAIPTFASRAFARAHGLDDRPIHPALLLNLGISFSVHDVSERAIAHLAYIDARFPAACYPGDTVRASSRVVGVKTVSSADKGVVHVHTELVTDRGVLVCSFDRKALVRAGKATDRPVDPPHDVKQHEGPIPYVPELLTRPAPTLPRHGAFPTFYDDLQVGDVIVHETGRTISEAEQMQLSTLVRNSHPLHLDEIYCKTGSFAKTRVVYGGLVLAWVLALSSRDTAGNAIWDLGLDEGAHPSGVLAGDTLFAASKVLSKEERGPSAGAVRLRIVGLKNTPARAFLDRQDDLFTPELGKTSGKISGKVVEITRTLLVRRRA